MTEQYDERQARKAYMRRRQRKVFAVAGSLLVVLLVVALMFYFHLFGLGVVKTSATQPNYGVTAPCVPKAEDGSTRKYVDNRDVNVTVFNGTAHVGFAKAVRNALVQRGFPMNDPQTYYVDGAQNTDLERTMIRFGKNAIAEAYTLNANFTDAVLVMDDREDTSVDVVLGATFNDLVPVADVPGADKDIADIEGCVAADQMTGLPHYEVVADPTEEDAQADQSADQQAETAQ
ncbi:LytR C-terminal domain-containing protein [Bifidobacterium samirii]|uniref:LytR cell envelope-related transcriptional attenuator n=1 Tax=Bifidobacterium samirii TaxID=2306974 RepID=A0A430FV51_9BIFI|nr:LytR C-terminal domain-containing protein [Bifidobacterium samirii]RSX57448.1 LytR cell envelope-related transcriptional attenuator [Bifidobacterium samirii]